MSLDSWWVDLSELDDEQQAAIDLSIDGNYLLLGPPGSGKTNLLLLRASYLVRNQRSNVVVLMFTRELREFILRGADNYDIAPDKIMTIMKWAKDLAKEHNIPLHDLPTGFDAGRRELANRLSALLDRRPLLEHHLECILVDEVQDCLPEEISLFFRCAKTVFFAGDARQKIYQTEDTFASISNRVETRTLSHHYRNGREICIAADAIGKTSGEPPILPSCNYKEHLAPSDAKFVECRTGEEQANEIIQRLTQQIKTYPDELLGVACPTRDDTAKIRAALAQSPLADYLLDEGDLTPDPERRIHICNVYQAKGLEYRALHLAFMEHITTGRAAQKRIAFTALTRAKTSLTVYFTSSIPGYLSQARDAVESKPKKPVDLNDLFARKKK